MAEPDSPNLDVGDPFPAQWTRRLNATFLRGRLFATGGPYHRFQMGPIYREINVTQTTGEPASIRRDSRIRKRACTKSRLSTTVSNGGSSEQAAKSHAVTHKPKQDVREVERRCREIIAAFGLHPLSEGRLRHV